jgi:hypothetical protein
MDHPLVPGILYRVMRMCIDPTEERGADPAGELHDQPRDGSEFEMFWPGHMDIRKQDADAGTDRDKEHHAGIGKKERAAHDQGTHQGKGQMMTGDHGRVCSSTQGREIIIPGRIAGLCSILG